ncbi:type II secretion system F family protein [Aneurinibacillus thermoaerophilus]|uniref:type II secretion system F family protein n=1 Tax=Aneurinibacillus thermoaerophilus TaxID=143495 RepID=UPI002E23CE07|nr:type II secretion system F family protein [Aneurinibacillus thermoaerophilus]
MALLVFAASFLLFLSFYFIRKDRKEQRINRVTGDDVQEQFEKAEKEERKNKQKGMMHRVSQAGLKWNLYEYIGFTLLLSLATGLVVYIVVKGVMFGVLGVLSGPLLMRYYLSRKIYQRREIMTEQLKPVLRSLANQMRASKNITQSIEHALTTMEEPLKSEFEMILSDIRGGMTESEAFLEAHKRIPVKEFKLVALGVATSKQTGGKLSDSFYNAAKMITKRQEGKEKAYTYSEGIRTQGNFGIGILIFIFVIMRFVFSGIYSTALHSFTGQTVIFGFILEIILLRMFIKKQLDNIQF